MRKLFEIKCNVVAFLISLLVWKPISRRYDDWFYWRGNKISACQIELNKYLQDEFFKSEREFLFGKDFIDEMEERKSEVNGLTLSEDGIWYQNPTTSPTS
jgi:hypothetical protein